MSAYSEIGRILQDLAGRLYLEMCQDGVVLVIDRAYAEPEINWPGALVGAEDSFEMAMELRDRHLGRIYHLEIKPKLDQLLASLDDDQQRQR